MRERVGGRRSSARHRIPANRAARRAQRGQPRICREPAEAPDASESRHRGLGLLRDLRRRSRRRRCDPSGGGCRARVRWRSSRRSRPPRRIDRLRARARDSTRSWGTAVCWWWRLTRSCASPARPTARRSTSTSSGTGALVLVDWLSSGRRAAGERWAFDLYSSRTTVRVDGRLIFYDGLTLDRKDGDVAERMGRFDVLATVLIVGASLMAAAHRGHDPGQRDPSRPPPECTRVRITPCVGSIRAGGRLADRRHVRRAGEPNRSRASRLRPGSARRRSLVAQMVIPN